MTDNLPAVLRGEAEPKRVGDRRRAKLLEAADRIVALEARVAYLDRDGRAWEDLYREADRRYAAAEKAEGRYRTISAVAWCVALALCLALIASAAYIQAGCGR